MFPHLECVSPSSCPQLSPTFVADSLASNSLVFETGYVKKSKVQGELFEVGSKVVYNGRQMIISKAPDGDGDIKMLALSAVFALCDALPQMKALVELKYAATHAARSTPAPPCPVTFQIWEMIHASMHLPALD